jgi:hypothetical protein
MMELRKILSGPSTRSFLSTGLGMLALIVICLKVWTTQAPNIYWNIALSGFSPIDWVNHLKVPQNFSRDFPQGSNSYNASLFMYVYRLADSIFGVGPEKLISIVILFEMLFMGAASAIFFRALIPNALPIAAFIFAILVVNSGARSMELAGFGGPFFWGLYYNFADGMRLIALAMFLQRKFLIAALLFALSVMTHPIMGVMGGVFAIGHLVSTRHNVDRNRILLSLVTFLFFAGGWWLYHLQGVDATSYSIPSDAWIAISKAFNFHFYPIDNGLLTFEYERRLLPFLLLIILSLYYIFDINLLSKSRRGIFVGLAFLLTVTVAGLVISNWSTSPILIKITLIRASDMFILVCLCLVVAGLISSLQSNRIFCAAIAGALLISPFVGPPFPVIYVSLLVLSGLPLFGEVKWRVTYIFSLGLLTALGIMIFAYYKLGFVSESFKTAYLGSQFLWQFALCICGGGILCKLFHRSGCKLSFFPLSFTLIVLIYASWSWRATVNHGPEEKPAGLAFMNAQLWAKDNSAPGALFMVDPTIYYGWRDFSQRSSFGNMREWLHTSWLYDSNRTNYDEGMRRAEEFGLSPFNYLNESPTILGYEKMDRDLRATFYSFDENWFLNMSHKYGINYVVMRKKYIQKNLKFEKEYENDFIIIFKIPA